MLDCEEEEKSKGKTAATISSLITSFIPRQILLSSSSTKQIMKHDKENSRKTTISLTPEIRVLLHQSICQFLENNGFSKTLKKFRREADIEKDSWKSCLLTLEEICCKYLETCNEPHASENAVKQQCTKEKDGGVNHTTSIETVERKSEHEGEDGKSEAIIENHSVDALNEKSKKKKKSKSANGSSEQVTEDVLSKASGNPGEDTLSVRSEPVKKTKDKKPKVDSEPLNEELQEKPAQKKEKSKSKRKEVDNPNINNSSMETTDFQTPKDEGGEEKKGSKKRKKSSPEENGTDLVEKEAFDNSKRRKIENSDETNGTVQSTEAPNRVLEKDAGEKSQKQDKVKQLNGSAEPTSANAFRRVKPDEVVFADDKLQDNSYWAKDGAESGYGAKAQEVLGQVRGRDFRHEKTKKKRGSYRGGQINLQSHSVKFNYDDDDE